MKINCSGDQGEVAHWFCRPGWGEDCYKEVMEFLVVIVIIIGALCQNLQ